MNIRQAMKIEASGQRDVKLTKAAELIKNGDRNIIEKSLNNLKLNDWIGLALNPNLTGDDIELMYKLLKEDYNLEREKNIPNSTKTRNAGTRAKIRNLLAVHPNIKSETIDKILKGARLSIPTVLNNPKITSTQIDNFFNTQVLLQPEKNMGSYSFVGLDKLMQTSQITKSLVQKWFDTLKEYADWTYSDNQWYSVIKAFLEFDDCPEEIINLAASAPLKSDNFWSNTLRKMAVNHKNASNDTMVQAYKITEDEQFLPDDVKDIFVF